MKLRRLKGSESFYEAFSDLIFGTMAIFVLLFVIILTQVHARPKPQKAVDLVVAIDVSGSMETPLQELISTLGDLSKNFPSIVKDFRVGVVAYSERFPGGMTVFDLAPMTPDNAERLNDWLKGLSAESSLVDVNKATFRAIDMLKAAEGENRRRSLVLIGDVGPYEARNGQDITYWTTGHIDRGFEAEAQTAIARFIQDDPEHRILTIFTPTSSPEERQDYAYSRSFFCTLAQTAGEQGRFTARPAKLVWELMQTFLQEPEKRDSASRLSNADTVPLIECNNA